jgi:dolichyl-phosphate-mannose-protein mannosyltransferase
MKLPFASSLSAPRTILGVCILSGLGLRLVLCFVPGYPGDQLAWAGLAQTIVTEGVSHIYALTLRQPELGVYPPLYHYLLAVVGIVYQQFFSPSFIIPSSTLNFLLKLPPVLGDCFVGLLIYMGVRRLAGEKNAISAVLVYIFNPAIIYTSAYWGMFGDSLYVLCILLSFVAICSGRANVALIAMIAGISLKPQAIAFAPIIIWATFRVAASSRWVWTGIIGILTFGVIWAPFIFSGTLQEALWALRQTVGLFPVLSANAHNFWYLLSLGNSWVSDATPLIGPLTARMLGLGAFGTVYIFLLYALLKTPFSEKSVTSTAAYIAFAFFMLSTEMHENYLFPAVSLLAFTFWQSKHLKTILIILTLTAFANMALHDVLLNPSYWLPQITVDRLTILNSGINVLVFIVWTCIIIRDLDIPLAAQPRVAPDRRVRRAR